MKFTTRDLMVVIIAVAVHFGCRYWFSWKLCIPPTVALVAAMGLSRPTRGILFSFWVGTFAGLASAAEMTVEMFRVPIDQGGLPWSQFWDVALHLNATFALVGAIIGAFVGLIVRLISPATKSQDSAND
jgi:hypothetical protein